KLGAHVCADRVVQRLNRGEVLACALIIREEEELVLNDGAAKICAELIQLQRQLSTGFEVVMSVKSVVAEELKHRAVKLIGAALGDDIHLRSEGMAGLGGVAVVGEIDFLNAVDAGAGNVRLLLAFGVQKAGDITAHGALPVHRNIQPAEDVFQTVYAALKFWSRPHRAGRDL